MADRIVLMRAGEVEMHGTPEDLYNKPATVFTARFIGTPPMNVLPAADAGPSAAARLPAGRKAETVSLGVRPEHMRLAGNGVHATVISVEYLGADSLVEARLGSSALLVRVPGKADLAEGQSITLDWDAADEHFFDTETGKRLS